MWLLFRVVQSFSKPTGRKTRIAIFATLELVSDPHMREAILEGIDDLNHGREYTAEEAERILASGDFR